MKVIHGPIAESVGGGVVYQVTLASGMIVTNPAAFGEAEHGLIEPGTVVSEGGQVLAPRDTIEAFARSDRLDKTLARMPKEIPDEEPT